MLYIVGAGGFGREVYDVVLAHAYLASTRKNLRVVFLDDGRAGENVRDLPVLTPEDAEPGAEFVVAIANPAVRRRLSEALTARGLTPATVRHPAAIVGPETTIGPGSVILALAHVSSSVTLASTCR